MGGAGVPNYYAKDGMGGGMNYGGIGGGIGQFLGSLFNDPRHPWADAQRAYDPWMDKAGQAYNPFYQGGVEGMGKYQDWLNGMKDPGDFINKTMGQYKMSDWAKNMFDYANKAGVNAGSASGMVGSTPWAQQMQQNSANISSQDMQNWLNQVLGVNSQYGQGWGNMMNQGMNAANGMAGVYGNRARDEAEMAYGKDQAGQQRSGDMMAGVGNIIAGLFGL